MYMRRCTIFFASHLPLHGQTDMTENITFPQVVKIASSQILHCSKGTLQCSFCKAILFFSSLHEEELPIPGYY